MAIDPRRIYGIISREIGVVHVIAVLNVSRPMRVTSEHRVSYFEMGTMLRSIMQDGMSGERLLEVVVYYGYGVAVYVSET